MSSDELILETQGDDIRIVFDLTHDMKFLRRDDEGSSVQCIMNKTFNITHKFFVKADGVTWIIYSGDTAFMAFRSSNTHFENVFATAKQMHYDYEPHPFELKAHIITIPKQATQISVKLHNDFEIHRGEKSYFIEDRFLKVTHLFQVSPNELAYYLMCNNTALVNFTTSNDGFEFAVDSLEKINEDQKRTREMK
jgi:hypothetical protein